MVKEGDLVYILSVERRARRPKAAIFDLDGVIVDTVPLHFRAWKSTFLRYGKDLTFEEYKEKIDGIPRIDGVRAVFPDLPEDRVLKIAEEKQKEFLRALDKEGVKVYQDALDLIRTLKGSGLRVAVVSSSKNCIPVLRRAGIEGLFDLIVPGQEVRKGKPHPEIFLLAANRLGLEPRECVVFEDATLGVKAAKRGGFPCIGIDRYGDPARLEEADLVVDDLSSVDLKTLEELLQ